MNQNSHICCNYKQIQSRPWWYLILPNLPHHNKEREEGKKNNRGSQEAAEPYSDDYVRTRSSEGYV